MFSLRKSALVAGLLAAPYILALPAEPIVTAAHSCSTFTAEAPQRTDCPTLKCGPVPDCILEEQTTLYVPPADVFCSMTGTTTTQGPCPTCQTGCAIIHETVVVTTSLPAGGAYKRGTPASPTTTSSAASASAKSGPCTYTVERLEPFIFGPTKTLYPFTVTETVYYDCDGCEYVDVRNIGGLGPVQIFTTTTFDPKTATTTAFKCAPHETAV